MDDHPLDLDALIGAWRGAFESAQSALRAGSHDLPGDELRDRTRRLAEERGETVRLLDGLARDQHAEPLLVRLVASTWEAKRLLGLPTDVAACVFNVDGVLVGSAAIHADVWREMFDQFISRWIERTGMPVAPFNMHVDYPRLVHGRPRFDAVHEFLASRGIYLPDGSPDDPPDADTVHGLANRKKRALLERLQNGGVSSYQGARLYLELARDASVSCAVVSGSTNTAALLERAHLTPLIDDRVDGNTMVVEHLQRKPAPDMLLAACRHLGVEPEHTAVFETTADGIVAGRAGGFELVVAVDQGEQQEALRAEGADLVVADLGELLEHGIAA